MKALKLSFTVAALLIGLGVTSLLYGHCEIPCGIYGDQMRFDMWEEQMTTVEKSMNEIIRLSKEATPNYNQIVRWVENKDKHADDIREIATQYFLAQRVKPTDASDQKAYAQYLKKLEVLHKMIVHAMQAKQTTDLDHVTQLRALAKEFHNLYFGPAEKAHLEEHKK